MMYEIGTVLLFSDGRLGRVLSIDETYAEIQYVDRSQPNDLNLMHLDIETDLGKSPSVLCQFYAAWNNRNKVIL